MSDNTTRDVLDVARVLRRKGELAAAAALLTATLEQPAVANPPTIDRAGHTGWLVLERAHIHAQLGDVVDADAAALRALAQFERAGDRGGQATACLLVGDLNWQTGVPKRAAGWWHRARALAEGAGNSALAARSLASLAMLEFTTGRPQLGESLLQTAEIATATGVADAIATPGTDAGRWLQQAAGLQDRTARAAVALMRAREAMRAGNYSEARLLLSVAAEVGRELDLAGLHIDALRLDAAIARRQGDPRSAVEALQIARERAEDAALPAQAALIGAELVLALADNEQFDDAFAQQGREPAPAIAALPAVHAARLESYAVLARHGQRLDAARKALADAADVRAAAGDVAGVAQTLALLASVHAASGELDLAEQIAERAAAAGRESGRLDASVAAELTWLRSRWRRGAPVADLLTVADTLSVAAAAVGTVQQRLAVLDLHVELLAASGDVAQAWTVASQAVDIAADQPLVRLRGRARARLALVWLARGEPLKAAQQAQEAARGARAAGDRQAHARSLAVVGAALRALGRHDEALLALQQAVDDAIAVDRPELAAAAGLGLGDAQLAIGQHEAALAAFERAREQADRVAARRVLAQVELGRATCLRALGLRHAATDALAAAEAAGADPLALCAERARALLDAADTGGALQIIDDMSSKGPGHGLRDEVSSSLSMPGNIDKVSSIRAPQVAELLRIRGQALAQAGRPADAVRPLRDAVRLHRRVPVDERGAGAALFLLGQVEGQLGNGAACGEALGEALVITARLGLPEQHAVRRVIERLHAQAEAN